MGSSLNVFKFKSNSIQKIHFKNININKKINKYIYIEYLRLLEY